MSQREPKIPGAAGVGRAFIAAGLICSLCFCNAGCGGSSKVAKAKQDKQGKDEGKQTPPQDAGSKPDTPADKADPADSPAEPKPLKIRRLKRDPRSVLDQLDDNQVQYRRNSDGNVRVVSFAELVPEVLKSLPRLDDLEELAIQDAGEGQLDAKVFQELFSSAKLRSLELHGRAVTSEHLQAIDKLEKLKLLRLSGTRVDDQLLEQLPTLEQLEQLELSWSRVTDDGVVKLKSMPQMKTLDLSYTDITDSALEALGEMKSLRTLILSGTSISEAAGDKLREALSDTRIIGLPSDGDLPPPPPDPDVPPPGLIDT